MLVLETATGSAPEGKGVENGQGKGGVTLSGSMTRQVSASVVIEGRGVMRVMVVVVHCEREREWERQRERRSVKCPQEMLIVRRMKLKLRLLLRRDIYPISVEWLKTWSESSCLFTLPVSLSRSTFTLSIFPILSVSLCSSRYLLDSSSE